MLQLVLFLMRNLLSECIMCYFLLLIFKFSVFMVCWKQFHHDVTQYHFIQFFFLNGGFWGIGELLENVSLHLSNLRNVGYYIFNISSLLYSFFWENNVILTGCNYPAVHWYFVIFNCFISFICIVSISMSSSLLTYFSTMSTLP